ncbi:hypothetical protein D9619_009249 [Psilocybe cf. subviscida]|uniref:Uncharacterized protein n=1 Tax=Psilocybe cf. subviscida TaxID=2480587 RepID=A0A8H5BUL8_9AGAR|nr:hypothetical protein D9619_009249 [Psilocybe cf. subviscida]
MWRYFSFIRTDARRVNAIVLMHDTFCGKLPPCKGRRLASGFLFPVDTKQHGVISHVALDACNPPQGIYKRNCSSEPAPALSSSGRKPVQNLAPIIKPPQPMPPVAAVDMVSTNENKNGTEITRGFWGQLMWEVATASS